MAISILALPFFSLASISSDRSPSGNTVMASSPMESERDRARMPSAMRFNASAASDGVAAPSNSNSRLSPIVASFPGCDADERAPRPAQLHGHVIRPFLLFDFDVEDDELGCGKLDLMITMHDGDFARKYSL